MLSASLGLAIYLLERVILPFIATVRERQDAAEDEDPATSADAPSSE